MAKFVIRTAKNTSGGQPFGGLALWERQSKELMPRRRRAGVGESGFDVAAAVFECLKAAS